MNKGVAIIHLALDRSIVASNDLALKLLREGDALFEDDGVLRARRPADDSRLSQLLRAALPAFGDLGKPGSMALKRPSPSLPLGLLVRRLNKEPIATMVAVADPERSIAVDSDLLHRVLNLTRSEAEIATLLAAGGTPRGIAEYTGRSLETVRWHIKRMQKKLGIRRQVDLVRCVLSFDGFSET
ncbi:helix-turn-helix transcriptional regulator [Candidatus Palauibacter sp.]|uniref:helix-turn-helix transcriptional regulator n=1 Tax=Candidatus Palauibacter sp. TaxID=3101350 RepID=UPI003B52508E